MSLFQVNLNNRQQGLLDLSPGTQGAAPGAQYTTSRQRTVYIMGPGKVNRLMNDRETFQDCNYYKRFAYPQCSLEDAILTVVTDDGSVYSDDVLENTFPYSYHATINPGTTYADNTFDILTDTGGYAVFAQLDNPSATALQVRINGNTSAVFTLSAASTQVFNAGDLSISMIEVASNVSGAAPAALEILVSVRSVCNS
jgi:hypothetical protein